MITPTDKAQAEQAASDSFLTLPEVLKQVALLTSEVETLRKDKNRLDWLELHPDVVAQWWEWYNGQPYNSLPMCLRHWVDAAMQEKGGCE